MSKTLEGMARAYCKSRGIEPQAYHGVIDGKDAYLWEAVAVDLKAALLWLADNVTDEMVLSAISHPTYPAEKLDALRKAFQRPDAEAKAATEVARAGISRAIRAAAEGK